MGNEIRKGASVRILKSAMATDENDVERVVPAGTIGTVAEVRDSGSDLQGDLLDVIAVVDGVEVWLIYDDTDRAELETL